MINIRIPKLIWISHTRSNQGEVKWKSLSCVQVFVTPWSTDPGNSPGQNTGVENTPAFPFSRASSQPRDQTQVSCIAGRFFTVWTIQGQDRAESTWDRSVFSDNCGWTCKYLRIKSLIFLKTSDWQSRDSHATLSDSSSYTSSVIRILNWSHFAVLWSLLLHLVH